MSTVTSPYTLQPPPGSKREVFERYKRQIKSALLRADEATSDLELVDALASVDFFLDKLHEELKGCK